MTQTLPIPGTSPVRRPAFLTAEWRYLVMLNYEIDPDILQPLVPPGTQLDLWQGKTYVSLVAFLFLNTKVCGIPIPFHRNFEEVNLRFYVIRPDEAGELRRGVVFVREIVPRRAVATVARRLYNENYCCMPMRHRITRDPLAVEYAWRCGRDWCRLSARAMAVGPQPLIPGSHEHFIAEHYWGYTKLPNSGCTEYHVEHAPWNIWQAESATLTADLEALYGKSFTPALSTAPSSAFLADGSPVIVRKGTRIC
jgi:hypothetical protein